MKRIMKLLLLTYFLFGCQKQMQIHEPYIIPEGFTLIEKKSENEVIEYIYEGNGYLIYKASKDPQKISAYYKQYPIETLITRNGLDIVCKEEATEIENVFIVYVASWQEGEMYYYIESENGLYEDEVIQMIQQY